MSFVPRLLAQVLPAMASDVDQVRQAANRVNTSLMDYIKSLAEEVKAPDSMPPPPSRLSTAAPRESISTERRDSTPAGRPSGLASRDSERRGIEAKSMDTEIQSQLQSTLLKPPSPQPMVDLDYGAAVNSLTLLFLNEHEATRVAALSWLLMLHRKAPRKVCTSLVMLRQRLTF